MAPPEPGKSPIEQSLRSVGAFYLAILLALILGTDAPAISMTISSLVEG